MNFNMKIDKELLKGSTNMLILSLIEEKPMYGYQMIKELSRRSQNLFEFQEGTLYPILHNLEKKNYISHYWINRGNKKRKYYSITQEGKKHLKSKMKEWQIFTEGINQILGGALFEY